jgi:hypothetical protein
MSSPFKSDAPGYFDLQWLRNARRPFTTRLDHPDFQELLDFHHAPQSNRKFQEQFAAKPVQQGPALKKKALGE